MSLKSANTRIGTKSVWNNCAVYKHTTQHYKYSKFQVYSLTRIMGAAFSIKNLTEHNIHYNFTNTKAKDSTDDKAVVQGSLVPAEKRIEKKLKFTKKIVVTVRSENPNLDELKMEIKTSHNAEYHNKYDVFVQDGQLTFKFKGTGSGQ